MSDAPVNFRQPVFSQERVCLGEMLAAEEAMVGGQRAGVCGSQHQMLGVLDQSLFRLALLPQSRNTTGSSR